MSSQSESHATWAVGLWISNDEALSYHKDVLVEEADDIDELADSLKEWIEEEDYPLATHTNIYTDLLGWALQQVDWHELAEDYWEDKGQEEEEIDEGDQSLPLVREDVQAMIEERRAEATCQQCGDSPEEDETVTYRSKYSVKMCDYCFDQVEKGVYHL